jgi:propanol-preferring alcohol dehydrogenase
MCLKKTVSLADETQPLCLCDLPVPEPAPFEILVRIEACAVCRTELDQIEGRLVPAKLPVVPGHQIVGRVAGRGAGASRFKSGDRVGIGWIHSSLGTIDENLKTEFRATGYHVNGGYAEYVTVGQDYAFLVPEIFDTTRAAPLLCSGAIGFRALKLCGLKNGDLLGLIGFGGSNHLVLQLAKHIYPDSKLFVFTRDQKERQFARKLGASWAGDLSQEAPLGLNAVIDTTPIWKALLTGLGNLLPVGRLVINAIRKEDIDKQSLLEMDYARHLWMEKEIKSVANVTQHDIRDFLPIAAQIPLKPEVSTYRLEEANLALCELKNGKIHGSKVLLISG